MDKKSNTFFDRLLERMDRLDPDNLQAYLLRLIREKGFFEGIFNSIHEGLIVIDNNLKIRFINSAAYEMFGIKENAVAEYIGKYFKQFDWDQLLQIPPEDWGRFSRREMEVFYPTQRLLSFYLIPMPERPDMSKRGLPLATLIFHDITESYSATEQQIETQKVQAITQLAAGVAHELGNPLNSLGIHLQILKRKVKKHEQVASKTVEDFINVAEQEINRLDAIVKNFLSAVRTRELDMQPINLRVLLSDAIGFMRPEIESKGIKAELSFPESLPALNGDPGQLTQAFFNIIKNAIQAMPDGGLLIIGCEVDDVFVNIKFSDTGKGLNETELSKLMDAFFTTKADGHGLGLLIVDRIIHAHGGELLIEGRPGQGADFTIKLPRHERIIRQLNSAPIKTEAKVTHH